MLRLEGVQIRYGAIHALKGVDLTVREGTIVTLIGANGAGKTTTLRTISGLKRASAGEDRVRGGVDRLPAARTRSSGGGSSRFPRGG